MEMVGETLILPNITLSNDGSTQQIICFNMFRIDPSPCCVGIDRLPCQRSDIQPLDGQYKKGICIMEAIKYW